MTPIVYKNLFDNFNDERGFTNPIDIKFLYKNIGLNTFDFKYQLISYNQRAKVFRGFHYQKDPFDQVKILLVHKGSIVDMVFPVNKEVAPKVQIFNLDAGDVLLIPSNYAHAYYTKTNDVILQYMMDKEYNESSYSGYYDSNFIKSNFDVKDIIISSKDLSLPSIELDFD